VSLLAALVAVTCVVLAAVLTAWIWQHAARLRLIDVPNERSSHASPVARGGGIAIALIVLAAALILTCLQRLSASEALAWLGGGTLVAVVGLRDDWGGLSVRLRLLVQVTAALSVAWLVDGFPGGLGAGTGVHIFAWVLGAVCVVWGINLFNFMDGIDGLAAQQALFVAAAAWLLGAGPPLAAPGWMLLVIAGAAGGFLIWNWSPARIFMGDVGSGFLGFALALEAFATSQNGSLSLWTWSILQGAFLVDATLTVLRRAARGARIQAPHREHAYQRLARHFGSHARVSGTVAWVNVLWLLPCAAASVRLPALAGWVTLVALLPLVAAAFACGAGCAGEMAARSTPVASDTRP
jgi:Fuc2NAc and GlcNAc transferase